MDKIDFKKRAIKETKSHYIILQWVGQHKDITLVNIYTPNIGAPKNIKKILKILKDFKKDTDNNTVIVGDFKTPLSTMERSSKQRINKDIVALNNSRSNGLNCYIQNFSPQRSKVDILCKCTWNIFKDRPHGRTQNKPQQIQENLNHIKNTMSWN